MVEMLEDVEVRLAPVSSPISVVWRGRKLLLLPPYMMPRAGHDELVLTADERRAILEHEAVHLDLDGEARWHELKRRELLKALLLAVVITMGWELILYLTIIMGLLIGAPIDLGLAGLWKAFFHNSANRRAYHRVVCGALGCCGHSMVGLFRLHASQLRPHRQRACRQVQGGES